STKNSSHVHLQHCSYRIEGYDDIPQEIVDTKAEKPEDWDEQEDGEWTAPKKQRSLLKKHGEIPRIPLLVASSLPRDNLGRLSFYMDDQEPEILTWLRLLQL
ncbi:hypothetical protein MKW94_016273, partial [Papaver nudicaule]|nr:hypothetical protein [Papaver nudicaule]